MHSPPSARLILMNPPFLLGPKDCTFQATLFSLPTIAPFSKARNRWVKGWQIQTATASSACISSFSSSYSSSLSSGASSRRRESRSSALMNFQMSYSGMWLEVQGQHETSLQSLHSGCLILWVCRQFLVFMLQRITGSDRSCSSPSGLILWRDLQSFSSSSSFISTRLPMNTSVFSPARLERVWWRSSRKEAQALEAKLDQQMLFSSQMMEEVFWRLGRRTRPRRLVLQASHYYSSEQQTPINIILQGHCVDMCDQQLTSTPSPSPSMPSTLYLGLVPWLRAQQSSVSLPQQVSKKVLVATVFQRAQVFLPAVSVATTQQLPKLGLKTDWLKVMKVKSLPAQQFSKQRHLRSQQFQARSERGAPVLTIDFWAVYQQSWVLRKLHDAATRRAIRTIRVLFISMICLQFKTPRKLHLNISPPSPPPSHNFPLILPHDFFKEQLSNHTFPSTTSTHLPGQLLFLSKMAFPGRKNSTGPGSKQRDRLPRSGAGRVIWLPRSKIPQILF